MAARKTTARGSRKTTRRTRILATKTDLPSVTVDHALRGRWEAAIARLQRAQAEEMASWDERYETLDEILEDQLYLAGGYRTARAFLAEQVPDQDERTVRQYVRVARCFEPEDEARHGIAKLDALLDYLEAAGGGKVAPAKIDLGRQKIRMTEGGKPFQVAFADVTREALRRATRTVRAAKGKVAQTVPPLVKALRAVAAAAGASEIGIRVAKSRVDLTGIPASRLKALGAGIARAKLPITPAA